MASLRVSHNCRHVDRQRLTRLAVATPRRAVMVSTQASLQTQQYTRVQLKTRQDCELAVSFYPRFRYNALGGGGWGTVTDVGDGKLHLSFDTSVLVIPDMSYRTAFLMGLLPIPPPLNIAIRPVSLEGILDTVTGEVNLNFESDFYFTAGTIYQPPGLKIRTVLTTESTRGRFLSASGRRLVGSSGVLVGTATVEAVGDGFMDTFLQLPNDALAVMSCDFVFE
ncbi:hypothetical protein VOLCADRAFT_92733 [Volvox carteri f. nagariensis]|uniref:Uncharacterized protein n=1 Tax=Volvox carteri f. nagariensis TaxID=3068 RepID=D8U0D9_VOLCA|nr:uncharacterized protein VOLCADRAFT_92733 [Volvox carteri f. nagariensis]EFJ46927.1 hypothetical protein VOLCADRAFT_92733 [Volvox carteri f. nagariensis]|eukprot:XP_002952136.1 hypothetical protein VOLCADRAFT_92733 [Volvox carteri f. nagariensis]